MRNNYIEWLGSRLGKSRMAHSLAVEQRARALARIHGENEEKAALAGLLHDCCKALKKAEQLKIIEKRGILLNKLTLAEPKLWHAPAGAIVLEDELGIKDERILTAVRQHTTGAAGMSRFSQIIYLADLTSEDRVFPDLEYFRELSEKNLDQATLECLAFIIRMIIKDGGPVAEDSIKAYNHFWLKIHEGDKL